MSEEANDKKKINDMIQKKLASKKLSEKKKRELKSKLSSMTLDQALDAGIISEDDLS